MDVNIQDIVDPWSLVEIPFSCEKEDVWLIHRLRDTLQKIFSHRKVSLPLVVAQLPEQLPGTSTFFCLSRYRANSFKFFFDVISQWLVPGKRLNVTLVHAVDFCWSTVCEGTLTLSEVKIAIEESSDLEVIKRNFPLLETEIGLGVDSAYYAHKIMEIKGLAPDQKIVAVQQYLASLVRRWPKVFRADLFVEMQHLMILCSDTFVQQSPIHYLGRLIVAHYLFRQKLLSHIQKTSSRRELLVKLFFPIPRDKKRLTLTVGLNFLRDKEILEQRHLLAALRHYVPRIEIVEQTFFQNRRGAEQMVTLHVDLQKLEQEPFSKEELSVLRNKLPSELRNHIGRLLLPVLMPRHEEEIARQLLALSQQLRYCRDVPQVVISFDEQTDKNLFFTVVWVRLLQKETFSIQELLKYANSDLIYLHDRTKVVGMVRKKYPKEATVFRVKISKESFLRKDHSIDLYKARQAVVDELTRVCGEFRDFNGGMLSKQHEFLSAVRSQLVHTGVKYNDVLLENFFYSITPIMMRSVIEPHAFSSLFCMLVDGVETQIPLGKRCSVQCHYDQQFSYVLMRASQRMILDEMTDGLQAFAQSANDLIQGYIKTAETVCMGYIYRSPDEVKQQQFRSIVQAKAIEIV